MNKDCGIPLTKLNVDGRLTRNDLLMQLQADISGIPVIRAQSQDITALGVAMAAGRASGIGVWDLESEERDVVPSDTFLRTTTEDGKFLSVLVELINCVYILRTGFKIHEVENGRPEVARVGGT